MSTCETSHSMRSRRPASLLLVVVGSIVATFTLLGCVGQQDSSTSTSSSVPSSEPAATEPVPPLSGDITVSAAASLKESFSRIAADFKVENPDTTVTINFGSSGDLATQILSGAPVDVAAFASESNMDTLASAGLLDGQAKVFATNELVIVTKPNNPKGIKELGDLAGLADAGGTVSLCAQTAPCGKYASQVLESNGVTIPQSRVTLGQDVRATLSAVTDGDADAGIVYVTDAKAVGSAVTSVTIPTAQNAIAKYPVAVIKATDNAKVARAFMDDVLGAKAQSVLTDAGFAAP